MLNEVFDRIYCLNILKRADRWKRVCQSAQTHNFTLQRVLSDDFDHLLDDRKVIKELATPLSRLFGFRSMISCNVGHHKIWEDIVERGYRNALIFEDDFVFEHDYSNQKFQTLWSQIPTDWDIVYFGHYDVEFFGRLLGRKRRIINGNIVSPAFPTMTHAYAITGEHARKILETMPRAGWYVDYQMSMEVNGTSKAYAFQPDLIIQPDAADSEQAISPRNLAMSSLLYTKDIKYAYGLNLFRIFGYMVTAGGIAYALLSLALGLLFPGLTPYFAAVTGIIYWPDLKRNFPDIGNTLVDCLVFLACFAFGGFISGL